MLATQAPYAQYFDADGSPLDGGQVFFGVVNQNPEANPITVYWDAAGTQPALQPVQTLNGYTVRSGTPATLYADGNYSTTIRDKKGQIIVYAPDSSMTSNATTILAALTAYIAQLATADGAAGVGFDYALNYAARTVGWALRQDTVKVAWFSAAVVDGDWSLAIQAAHDWCEALPGGGFIEFPLGASMVCKTGLTLNPNRVGVTGNGTSLSFSTLTSGYGISFRQSSNDANERTGLNRAHPISNLNLIGTASAAGSVTCVNAADQNPIQGGYWLAGVTFRNVAFCNWWRDVEMGVGSFLFSFETCHYYITGGSGYDVSIQVQYASNSGENTKFDGCFFSKVLGGVIRQLNPNAFTLFRSCSADYTEYIWDVQGGEIDWDGYVENDRDSYYWGKVFGENSLLRVAGRFSVTGNKSAYEMFSIDPSCVNGGLDLDISIQFSGGVTLGNLNICKGLTGATSGRVVARLRAHSRTTVHPAIGGGATALANGDFETTSLTDWTLGGTSPPIRSTTPTPHSGTNCLRFPASTTNTPTAQRSLPCDPGQQLIGSFWYQSQGLEGSGGTFGATINYLDAGGTLLAGNDALVLTTNINVWTFARVHQFTPAPAGTASAVLTFLLFGTTSGAPNAYIDDITLKVV